MYWVQSVAHDNSSPVQLFGFQRPQIYGSKSHTDPSDLGAFILRAPEGSSATIRTVFQKYLSAVDEGYTTDFGRVQDAKGKGKKGKNDHQKGKGKDAKGKGKNGKGHQKGTEGDRRGKGT